MARISCQQVVKSFGEVTVVHGVDLDVMDKEFVVQQDTTSFDEFLTRTDHGGRIRHVVVTHGDRIVGLLRVNTALRRGLEETYTGVTLGEIVNRVFTVAREDDVMFDVIRRMWQKHASLSAVVSQGGRVPRADNVVGVIAKEHVADSVADSIRLYTVANASL